MENILKNNQKDSGPDIKGILYRMLSKWYWFVLSIAIAIGAAKVYLRYQENIYNVSTKLMLTSQTNAYRSLGGLELFSNSNSISDEIHLIRSFDMISKVIDRLDFDVSYFHKGDIRTVEFYKNTPFKVVLDSNSFQHAGTPFFISMLGPNEYRLQADLSAASVIDVQNNLLEGSSTIGKIDKVLKFGEKFSMPNLSFTVLLTNPYYSQSEGKLFFTINRHDLLTNVYKNRLDIRPINKGSSIIMLSVTGPLVNKDIDYLNMVTEVYIEEGLEEKNRIASNTIEFIDNQLGKIADSLKSTEREIEGFRSKFNYKVTNQGMEKAIDKLDDLESEKSNLLMKTEYYQYVLEYISNNKDLKEIVAPSSIGIEDGILSSLVNELIKLKSERSVLMISTSEKNPYIRDLDQKIKTTTETLYENVNNILKVSHIPIKNINNRIAEIEKSLNGLPEKDRLWLEIQRKFNLNDHLYNFLLEKRAEAGITRASTKPDHQIVEKASWLSAGLIAPNTSSIYKMYVLFGVIIPLGILFLLEFLNDKIKSKDEFLSKSIIPLLGTIGHKDGTSNLIIADSPKSGIAEAFRSIRINLSYLASEKKNKIVVVTSSISGEGKTFFSINLANIIAISNKRTLLIGTDLRKPKIYNDFDIDNSVGLSSYLANKCGLNNIIKKTGIANFDVITAGPVPPNPAELLGSLRMEELLNDLKEWYDYIIIDTPPIGIVADGFQLMNIADVNLYMVRHNYTRYKMLEKINGLYQEGKINNLNLVMNDLNAMDAKYYGYYSNYGYGYYEDGKKENKIYLVNGIKRLLNQIGIN